MSAPRPAVMSSQIVALFRKVRDGDRGALDELMPQVYDELRRVASGMMRGERADHTLSPTAVVHEAVIRLLGEAVFDRAVDRSFLLELAVNKKG